MDLNASPLPEDDDQPSQEQVEDEILDQPIYESSVQTLHREREERRRRLKRENRDEGPKRHPKSTRNDFMTQSKGSRYAGKIRSIPHGWLDCPPFGQCLGGSIVPSKVPLDETYNDAVIPGRRYSSKQVINGQRRFGRELGLVVDLTNTTRYYSPLEYTRLGIKYIKIACKGRDAVPDNESVNKFVYEVMQFIGRQKHSRKTVLVHCTHGHNRTGFMIVHYLVRTKLCSVTEALHEFEVARPPGIYKRDYVEALYTFYHESPEKMVCPSTPDWKRSSDLDLNGEAVQDQDDDEDFDNTGYLHHQENGPITIDDVLGDAVCYDEQEFLRQKCYSLFELSPTGKGTSQFPGSHPVSLNRDNLQLLRQRYYYATWKADGTRYMMLIALHGCYLIDRNFCFRRVQLRFPLKVEIEGCLFHHYTLIDGEMIIDAVPDIGLKRRYLAYDLIALNNQSVIKLPFSERWKLLEEEVIRPRNNEKKNIERDGKGSLTYRYEMEPFGVRRKDFWLLSTVGKLLKGFIPSLSHASDGLIFQGWDDPYIPRTHEGLLKWKYAEMNSVDFLFEVQTGTDNRQSVFLYERGKKKLMDGCRVAFKDEHNDDLQDYSGKIIECSWDQENGCWVCMRVRTDKSTPNDINTYRKVMRSISDNITEDVLLNEISEIVRLPMYADRIEKAYQLQHRRR
ncbi:mRNA-capping enzyme-like isoform X4 [Phalaenopsis equestris]|uniref:mRNA-capping enzyme-like isoform X4 n=1 Tax=Phalaenopsis equestris TaxID=78828 RepID=UPI0009E3C578|nr:mRNA-capping enzyme-like isoform X4 [Phalaenopsis equestris]